MSAKSKGTRNEHRSMELFEACGFSTTRAAGSHGVWDFIAHNASGTIFVQVKTRDWPGSVEMEALKADNVPPNSVKLIHRWRARQKLPDVKFV